MSDSTRAENPGYTPSERTVGEAFRDIMQGLNGRVIVATFASNIARIQQVLDASATFGRHVAIIGRSMEQNTRIAGDLGYLTTKPGQLVPKDRLNDIPDAQLTIVTTGAQGEPMAGLARMANRDHRFVEIKPGDTVIVSASPIPGNEEYVARTIDNLFKNGANVYYHTIKRAHVSGHASQEGAEADAQPDQAEDLHPHPRRVPDARPARPPGRRGRRRAGEHLHHRERPVDRVPARRHVATRHRVEAGYVFVDGLSVGEVGDIVLRDRRALANDGMFLIVVTVDKQTGNLVGKPEIVTRGFVAEPDAKLIAGAIDRLARAIAKPGDHLSEIALLKQQIKDALSQYLYEQTRRRPMVFPVVVEV